MSQVVPLKFDRTVIVVRFYLFFTDIAWQIIRQVQNNSFFSFKNYSIE
jgi:hypothetical protein